MFVHAKQQVYAISLSNAYRQYIAKQTIGQYFYRFFCKVDVLYMNFEEESASIRTEMTHEGMIMA